MQQPEKNRPNHPFISREFHYRRIDELLEGNNRYLERARTAEARVKALECELSRMRFTVTEHAMASASLTAQVDAMHDELEGYDDVVAELRERLGLKQRGLLSRLFGRSDSGPFTGKD